MMGLSACRSRHTTLLPKRVHHLVHLARTSRSNRVVITAATRSTLLRLSNGLTNWTTSWTIRVFAFSVMAQDCSRRKAVRNLATVIFATFHVPPQSLHIRAMGGNCTNTSRSTFCGMVQQQQTLLLVLDPNLPFAIITNGRRSPSAGRIPTRTRVCRRVST